MAVLEDFEEVAKTASDVNTSTLSGVQAGRAAMPAKQRFVGCPVTLIALIGIATSAVACDQSKPPTSSEARPRPTPSTPRPPASTTPPTVEVQIDLLTRTWNDAHKKDGKGALERLFGKDVFFYGTKLPARQVVERKLALLGKIPDFQQKLVSKVRVIATDGRAHASFVKEVTADGKKTKYPSYLEFMRTDGGWVIVTEGDEVTDRNLTKYTGSSVGDFDGDGFKETARLIKPKVDEEEMECAGPCTCKIVFSDPKLPEIPIENCIGGIAVNEGDLDDDGADEVALLPWWFTSCWRSYEVHTIKGGTAKPLVFVMTHCNQWESGRRPIEKDPKRPGYVIIRETRMEDHSITEKSVKLGKGP